MKQTCSPMKQSLKRKSKSKDKQQKEKHLWLSNAEKALDEPYSLRDLPGSEFCDEGYTIREKAEKEGKDPEFAVKLHKIDRLHNVIDFMMTWGENSLMSGGGMSREDAKAEINRMCKRDGLSPLELSTLIWTETMLKNDPDHLSDEENKARIPLAWTKRIIGYRQMMIELKYLMKSLTPEQREFLVRRDRNRMLAKERRKRSRNMSKTN